MHLSGVGDQGYDVQCNERLGSMFGTYGAAVDRRARRPSGCLKEYGC